MSRRKQSVLNCKTLYFWIMVLFMFICCQSTNTFEQYQKHDYQDIRVKLKALEQQYPDIIKLDTAAKRFGLEYIVLCGEEIEVEETDDDEEDEEEQEEEEEDDLLSNKCILDIVTVSDHTEGAGDKVQVFISGALRGDSRVGPSVALYLIEYLASNFNKNPRITYLLKHREIVITPMTNA